MLCWGAGQTKKPHRFLWPPELVTKLRTWSPGLFLLHLPFSFLPFLHCQNPWHLAGRCLCVISSERHLLVQPCNCHSRVCPPEMADTPESLPGILTSLLCICFWESGMLTGEAFYCHQSCVPEPRNAEYQAGWETPWVPSTSGSSWLVERQMWWVYQCVTRHFWLLN